MNNTAIPSIHFVQTTSPYSVTPSISQAFEIKLEFYKVCNLTSFTPVIVVTVVGYWTKTSIGIITDYVYVVFKATSYNNLTFPS